jgi:non-heme chloroperoxidase
MNARTVFAILRKDVLSLYPLVLLSVLLFFGDVLLFRFELVPVWSMFRYPLMLLTIILLVFAVMHLDSPVSEVDDWLCRPVPRGALLTAKLTLLILVIYVPRALGTLTADLIQGAPLAEALQEALLLQNRDDLILLPVILFTGLVTRTLVKGFGVLIAIFVGVFVIPTPFIHGIGQFDPAIGDEVVQVGMGWLAFAPAILLSFIFFAVGCWLVYWRRRVKAARVLLAITILSALLLALLPMWIVPWDPVFAAHQMAVPPSQTTDTRPVYLRNSRACLSATRFGDLGADPAFAAARELENASADSIVFVTSIEPRGLPLDWRAKFNYVDAQYRSGDPAPLYSLRPVFYNTDSKGGGSLSHTWTIPDDAVRNLLSQRDLTLRLKYSLTLLKPTDYDLPTDGRHHHLAGLGYCSAKLDDTASRIEVDCFSASRRPAQISAELNGIGASRVYGPVEFSPRWTQWLFGQRVSLSIGSPRLARHDSITVTAWDHAGYVDETLSLPGILGGDEATCPVPTTESVQFQRARWNDSAAHEVSSVRVDAGVQLEVLDFGGAGTPVVLMPGLGATAHSYDELAPLLARHHRVIALTRRGAGYSSKPDYGFDTPRLAQDILQVMDAMKLQKVLLVGHSIAGDELTWLGGHHPDRFTGLVYLDAAYDRSGGGSKNSPMRELSRLLPPEPPIPPGALLNYEAMTQLLAQRGHVRLPEGELIAFRNVDKPFLAGTPNIDGRTQQAIVAAIEAPDYAALKIPALAIYAIPDPDEPPPPWHDANDTALIAARTELAQRAEALRRRSIEAFRAGVAQGEVLELQKAKHYVIQSNQREVLEAIETFAAKLAP